MSMPLLPHQTLYERHQGNPDSLPVVIRNYIKRHLINANIYVCIYI